MNSKREAEATRRDGEGERGRREGEGRKGKEERRRKQQEAKGVQEEEQRKQKLVLVSWKNWKKISFNRERPWRRVIRIRIENRLEDSAQCRLSLS